MVDHIITLDSTTTPTTILITTPISIRIRFTTVVIIVSTTIIATTGGDKGLPFSCSFHPDLSPESSLSEESSFKTLLPYFLKFVFDRFF
jgi:hypothetical protein